MLLGILSQGKCMLARLRPFVCMFIAKTSEWAPLNLTFQVYTGSCWVNLIFMCVSSL